MSGAGPHIVLAWPQLAEMARRREKWPAETLTTVAAGTMFNSGVRIHYPGYVFAHRGRLRSPLIPGAQDARGLSKLERIYLK